MPEQPEKSKEPTQSQDTTRDWVSEEEEALRLQAERDAEVLRQQRERE